MHTCVLRHDAENVTPHKIETFEKATQEWTNKFFSFHPLHLLCRDWEAIYSHLLLKFAFSVQAALKDSFVKLWQPPKFWQVSSLLNKNLLALCKNLQCSTGRQFSFKMTRTTFIFVAILPASVEQCRRNAAITVGEGGGGCTPNNENMCSSK